MTEQKCFGCETLIKLDEEDLRAGYIAEANYLRVICIPCWKDKFIRNAFLDYDTEQRKMQ